jgi:hypothetical protein
LIKVFVVVINNNKNEKKAGTNFATWRKVASSGEIGEDPAGGCPSQG